MKNFSLLIKPAGADCNLRCTYCFYYDHIDFYPENKVHRMNNAMLEKLVSSYMGTEQQVYSFNWQGGEPLLMGYEFFKKAVELQIKYGKPGYKVSNSIQTNGTLITDELAKFFSEYNFLLGVSLDGPSYVHDHYRKNLNNDGSYLNVMRGIKLLEKYNAQFNILTLVNSFSTKRAKEIFSYLCDNGFYYHQYIPCVEFDEKGKLEPYSISSRQWGEFLCTIFDLWKKNWKKVSVRIFDSILNYIINGEKDVCTMKSDCRSYLVIEHNGDVFPCDFFVTKELKLGNIVEIDFKEILKSDKFRLFGRKKREINKLCVECSYLDICAGDCLKNRYNGYNFPGTLSSLCEGWKVFCEHTLPELKGIAKMIKKINKKKESDQLRINKVF